MVQDKTGGIRIKQTTDGVRVGKRRIFLQARAKKIESPPFLLNAETVPIRSIRQIRGPNC